MPARNPPTDPSAQLQWLIDRAAISDLLIDFARALDDRDWEGYANNYAEDGVLALLPTVNYTGRAGMAEFVEGSLGKFAWTHHISSNHAIDLDGDTATTRSYLIAAHVLDASDPSVHGDVAGWYNCDVRRTEEGWRFARVSLNVRYSSGKPLHL